jgi:hypothetical protein
MGTGGRRIGAGRPATHVKAEHCRSLDIRRWHQAGVLQPGRSGSWVWTNSDTGEHVAQVAYAVEDEFVRLAYLIDGKPAVREIGLTRTACNYGGTRPWFVCPLRGERIAVLYLRGGRFACRHCQGVAHASKSEDAIDRSWRRQRKAEVKLGPSAWRLGAFNPSFWSARGCAVQRRRAFSKPWWRASTFRETGQPAMVA